MIGVNLKWNYLHIKGHHLSSMHPTCHRPKVGGGYSGVLRKYPHNITLGESACMQTSWITINMSIIERAS